MYLKNLLLITTLLVTALFSQESTNAVSNHDEKQNKMATEYGDASLEGLKDEYNNLDKEINALIKARLAGEIDDRRLKEKSLGLLFKIVDYHQAIANEIGEKKAEKYFADLEGESGLPEAGQKLKAELIKGFATAAERNKADEEGVKDTSISGVTVLSSDDEISLIDENRISDDDYIRELKKGAAEPEKRKKKKSRANINGFEENAMEGVWIGGGGGGAAVDHHISSRDSYAGDKCLYVSYHKNDDMYMNWVSISYAPKKALDLRRSRSITMAVKSGGQGGTLTLTLESGDLEWKSKNAYVLNMWGWQEVIFSLDDLDPEIAGSVTSLSLSLEAKGDHTFFRIEGGTGMSGIANPHNVKSGLHYMEPVAHKYPLDSFLMLDEISHNGRVSKLSAGKKRLNVGGKVRAETFITKNRPPFLRNKGEVTLELERDKYLLHTTIKIGEDFILDYNDATSMWLMTEAPEFTYYSTKQWEWPIDLQLRASQIGIKLKNLHSIINEINLGGTPLKYGHLAMRSVWNTTGIHMGGEFAPNSPYNLHFIKHQGAGYGLLGMLEGNIAPINLSAKTAFFYEDRRAKVIGDTSGRLYPTRSYQKAKIAFLDLRWHRDFEIDIKEKITDKDGHSDARVSDRFKFNISSKAGAYYSEEEWLGDSTPIEEDPERVLLWSAPDSDTAEDTTGYAFYWLIDSAFFLPRGVILSEMIEYRYLTPNFMGGGIKGDNSPLKGITYNYGSYLFNNYFLDIGRFLLTSEKENAEGIEISDRYWQDLNGIVFDTGLSWKYMNLVYSLDMSKKASSWGAWRLGHNLYWRLSMFNLALTYNGRYISTGDKSGSEIEGNSIEVEGIDVLNYASDMKYFANEICLSWIPVDRLMLMIAYANIQYGSKFYGDFSFSEIFKLQNKLYNNDIFFARMTLRVLEEVAFGVSFKKVHDRSNVLPESNGTSPQQGQSVGQLVSNLGNSFMYFLAALEIRF